MIRVVVTVVACLLILPAAVAASEPEVPEAEALARELLEVTGAGEMGKQVMEQMISSMQETQDDLAQELWEQLIAEVDPNELAELVIPIYVKHLTVEEMTAAIEFYRSPVGKSILEKMPLVMTESMAVGQRWGEELARMILERLESYRALQPTS